MTILWLSGLLRRRAGRILGTAAGVATVVALIAVLGGFIASAQATMARRAASTVAVDWQVQLAPGVDVAAATRTVRSAEGVATAQPVEYGQVPALTATTDGTTQRTGAARVVGLPAHYTVDFARQVRLLAGRLDGAVVAQQTAANLHVAPGDVVRISLGGADRSVRVTGIVELPQADSFFQTVGAPAGAQPAAPPDNVLLLPAAEHAAVFAGHRDLVTQQLHVRLGGQLAPDPDTAYLQVVRRASNLAVRLVGAGTVGDNLASTLDAARSDAAYANVLFVFLGAPGGVLAAVLTVMVSSAAGDARRREQALLRTRGAGRGFLARLVLGEALSSGVIGVFAGLLLAAVVDVVALGSGPEQLLSPRSLGWAGVAVTIGLLLVAAATLLPTLRAARSETVQAGRRRSRRVGAGWRRVTLGGVLLVVGACAVAATTRSGYSVVLAPEGVATVSVDYWAFLGPACLWGGGALLAHRVAELFLVGPRLARVLMRPFSARVQPVVTSFAVRRRRRTATGATLVAVAFAFAISTATFAATFQQQAEVDARLTNGADVRIDLPANSSPAAGRVIAATTGVSHAEPLLHRFAYVGADLQDLYGVRAGTIASATSLQDAYFAGATAAQTLARLAAHSDGILVSQETATDYALQLGDHLSLRVPSPDGGTAITVRFRYVGQVLEFPTAPRDSFLVVNAGYLAQQTHDRGANTYLVTAASPPATASALQRTLGPTAAVTAIGTVRSTVGSSLTSVDLRGLTVVELLFALVLAIAASGLLLLLGLRERRVTFALMIAVGATRRQLRQVLMAESLLVAVPGLLAGALLGGTLAAVLVAVLSGVFDPPPQVPLVPWAYVGAVALLVLAATGGAVVAASRAPARPAVEVLRDQ